MTTKLTTESCNETFETKCITKEGTQKTIFINPKLAYSIFTEDADNDYYVFKIPKNRKRWSVPPEIFTV